MFEEKSPEINIDQNLGKICADCGGNEILPVEYKHYRYVCEECGATDGETLDARENKVLDEITTNQEKGTASRLSKISPQHLLLRPLIQYLAELNLDWRLAEHRGHVIFFTWLDQLHGWVSTSGKNHRQRHEQHKS